MALAERPPDREPAEISARASLLLVLEGVGDADNVGSVFRNAAAFGAQGVLLSACCDPLYRKALRTSMGSVLQVPFAHLRNWPLDFDCLKREGFTAVALTPAEDAVDLSAFARRAPKPTKIAVLVGSEGSGLAAETLALADERVRIPRAPSVDSLNVATALGIALHCLTT